MAVPKAEEEEDFGISPMAAMSQQGGYDFGSRKDSQASNSDEKDNNGDEAKEAVMEDNGKEVVDDNVDTDSKAVIKHDDNFIDDNVHND